MSAIEGAGKELSAAINHLSTTNTSLSEAKKEYVSSAELLGEMLLRHNITVAPYIESAAITYENGVGHLRAGLKVFTEKVMPALMESGIQDIDGSGKDLHESVVATGTLFNDVLKLVLADFFKDEVFEKQQSAVHEAFSSTSSTHALLEQGVLAEGSPLNESITHIDTCIRAVNDYRESDL